MACGEADVAGESRQEGGEGGEVERVREERAVGGLPLLGDAVGYEAEGGGAVGVGGRVAGAEVGDVC